MKRRLPILGAVLLGTVTAIAYMPDASAQVTPRGEKRKDARDTRQEGRQDGREEKRDCRAEDEKTNADCRQDKREGKQDTRQEAAEKKHSPDG
jgi:hypothetical protein